VRRLDSLTGLRWLAAAAVFGYHSTYFTTGAVHDVLVIVFGRGGSGVGLFFVLSGFVLAWSSRPDDTAAALWRRRAARILPDYWVVWMFTAIVLTQITPTMPWRAGAANLLLLQAWIPRATIFYGWNGVAWSLSCEAFFYLVLPFALPRLARLGRTGRWRVIGLLLVVIGAFAVASVWLTPPEKSITDSYLNTFGWFVSVCPLGRLPEFLVGAVLALLLRDDQLPAVPVWSAAVGVGVGYAASYADPIFVTQIGVLVVPFALLVVALAQRDLAGRATPLARPSLVLLGEWSYAFYLVHKEILEAIGHHTAYALAGGRAVLWLLGGLAAASAGAYLLFTWVERPAERRLRDAQPRVMLMVPDQG
jgi:peptidoglycan/LPS O-acetylase OafA/YrhL